MDAFALATVFFAHGFSVEVGGRVYGAEIRNVEARLDGEWVHIRSDPGRPRADTFPITAIRCIAWDDYAGEPGPVRRMTREGGMPDLRQAMGGP
jgi:hypothetical protein